MPEYILHDKIKKEAIAFGKYIHDNMHYILSEDQWCRYTKEKYTTEELYQLYLKSKENENS